MCLSSGDYSSALVLLRGAAAEFPNDAELSELEKVAQDGVKRKAEADRLITESQELFAQRKSAEAIQLLRQAYELDKNNSLARAILANALVEHAHSIGETDWWEAETLAKQALDLNPAHPTAKTVSKLIRDQKKASSVEEWVSQVRKVQSSGNLSAALSWIAEGLAVYPRDPRLLQIQDAIQRDQSAQRRQARRRDLEDLRRMKSEIEAVADAASKKALAERIQAVTAKHSTDGEILSVANGLLHRLGSLEVIEKSSTASPASEGATLISAVPSPSAPKASRAATTQVPPSSVLPSQILPSQILPSIVLPSKVPPNPLPRGNVPPGRVPTGIVPAIKVPPSVVAPVKVLTSPPEAQLPPPQSATVPAAEPFAPSAKVTSPSSQPERLTRSISTRRILASAAAIILVAAISFFAGEHRTPPVAKTPAVAPTVPAPTVSAPAVSAPAQTSPEPSLPGSQPSSATAAGKVAPDDEPPAEVQDGQPIERPRSGKNLGTLLVVAGQDNARVFLNGKPLRQLTQAGQLRLPNLELKDYVVQVSKSGFQDPPQQKIRIHGGEQARLIFNLQPNLQPQPRLASLTIQGGAPGTTVLVDQTLVGTIQPDGTLSVSTVNPGDHIVELHKERFKPRQFKKHFVVGEAISLAAADAVLEAVPGELKITFAPADANVAIVKGEHLTMVSSGVPLSLAAGTYTLTARTADRFTRTSTLEVIGGQSKTLDLSLAPSGMSKWDDPAAWKHEGNSFIRKGGDFVLYGDVPASGTFVFSAMLTKGHLLQWVLNYTDPKNYVLFQMDDDNFYRTVIRNGEKADEIKVPDKGDKKSSRTLHIRVSPTELVHQIRHGDGWTVLDRWTQPGTNFSLGKFGFYIPGNDQVALSSFAHYGDLNIH